MRVFVGSSACGGSSSVGQHPFVLTARKFFFLVSFLCLMSEMSVAPRNPNVRPMSQDQYSVFAKKLAAAQNATMLKEMEEAKAYRSVRQATRPGRRRAHQFKNHVAIRILSSLTLPKESAPVRVGSAYGSDPTATAKLFRRLNAIWPTGELASDIPINDTAAFFFRDALRAMVYNYGIETSDQSSYIGNCELIINNTPSTAYPRYTGPLAVDLSNSTIAPHGEFLYAGRNGRTDPLRGFLCSAGSTINITVPATTALLPATHILITVRKFEADVWVEQNVYSTPATTGGVYAFSVAVTGYYAFDASVDVFGTGTPAVMSLTFQSFMSGTGMSSMWAQLPLPNLEDVLPVVKAFRVTSVSGMLTNTASPLNRQGQLVGMQLPKETNFLDYLDFDDVSGLAKSETLNVVNGMYGFLKPTSEDDFEMQVFQYSSGTSDVPVDYVFEIIPQSDFLNIHAQVNIQGGQQAYWTPAYNVEYESVSQWSELRVSEAKEADLMIALSLLPSVPQWHENDFHFSDIWDWIKDTASTVWDGVKEVASVVGPVVGAVAPFLI